MYTHTYVPSDVLNHRVKKNIFFTLWLNALWIFGSNSGRLPESNKRKQLTAQQKDLEGFDNMSVDNYYFRFSPPDETWTLTVAIIVRWGLQYNASDWVIKVIQISELYFDDYFKWICFVHFMCLFNLFIPLFKYLNIMNPHLLNV